MAIGDTHHPFVHPDALSFLRDIKTKAKPTRIVHMGDEIDSHAVSDYDVDPDGFSPGHEFDAAVESLKSWYREFPDVDVLESNHTWRLYRKGFKAGFPKRFFKPINEIIEAPKGWKWQEQLEIDGVLYEHGEGFTGRDGALKCAEGNMQSTVIGHVHSFAGIAYSQRPRDLFFGFNVGCLIDYKAYVFKYGKKSKNKPVLGAGLIVRGVPRFVPMLLDKNGRWVGKL